MNNRLQPPAPNPQDANDQRLTTSSTPLGFPNSANPDADIGESGAVQKAIDIAIGYSDAARNPKVVSVALMSYKEAMLLGPEPQSIAEEDPRSNMLVRVLTLPALKRRGFSKRFCRIPPISDCQTIARL